MNGDVWAALHAARDRDLRVDAAAERIRPRRGRGLRTLRCWYARAWWALRPRAASWIPGLFET
ncbi:hypothetical protein WIS52_09855 [Pseudonocardia nematodicida]|uniref:Uncharacterized protein n=1 Tax=Pseudonocardia nematodicida TaxID=1206997 RepID=A0ABV1K8H0_9PSEU